MGGWYVKDMGFIGEEVTELSELVSLSFEEVLLIDRKLVIIDLGGGGDLELISASAESDCLDLARGLIVNFVEEDFPDLVVGNSLVGLIKIIFLVVVEETSLESGKLDSIDLIGELGPELAAELSDSCELILDLILILVSETSLPKSCFRIVVGEASISTLVAEWIIDGFRSTGE